jgi:integrase
LTVNELVLVFMKHANKHYLKNGKVTDEVACIKSAIRPLVELYGATPVEQFGPLALKAVRQRMIDGKTMCRDFINKSIGRIRRVFRHAVENELVEPAVLQKLEAVAPLLAGRTEAIDHAPRKPVPQEHIDQVKAIVPERTKDIIELMLLTGSRPGELVNLTGEMINRSTDIWVADLADHKNRHRGKERFLVFGPKAQLILTRYLSANPSERLFRVARATIGNQVKAACDELEIERFSPHWLRHNAASWLREEYGLDVAQIMLGHASASMTELYAHLNLKKAITVARDAG